MRVLEQMNDIIEKEREALVSISKRIFDNPELGLQERFASTIMCEYLEQNGFSVTRGAGGLDTAYVAQLERGTGGFHVAFCAEYDALPEIGHACGHNLIGMASVTAGIALGKTLLGEDIPFKVSVIGTPDEEGTGGKIDLINAGVFRDVDICMMFHPGYETIIHVESLAFHSYEFIFHGKPAHAASEPWEGKNALDGVIQTFNAVNALRQHVKPDVRIHGIIKEGGLATNIVPERAVAEFCIRSEDNTTLEEVVERVLNCARGAAVSTGTDLEIKPIGHFYDAMNSNRALGEVFEESLAETKYSDPTRFQEGKGSIDMGNVSNVVPAIHPVLSLTEQMVPGHTPEFAAMCNTEHAYEVMLLAGKAMALTAYKVIQSPVLQKRIKQEFEESRSTKQSQSGERA
ncbi:M20 family metallopeptidase [Brevibacillus sp. H7]|uniref:M20 family metallopeptidase n=1 Tax=Brevibacillus sp. H7 TaxID=3349138 RepID=UPI0038245275